MVTHLIYHANCHDGFAAAFACWKKYPEATFIPANYGDAPPELPKTADVVIVDFSYPRDVMMKMQRDVATWACLDHHKTAKENCDGLTGCIFDMDHSGAWLSWNYFFPKTQTPELLLYVQDRDLWRFKMPKSREVNAALRSYPMDFAMWDGLKNNIEALKVEGVAILRHIDQTVHKMSKHPGWKLLDGHRVPFVNATCYQSEVGERLCLNHPEAPFSLTYFDRTDHKRQWGLRSRNGFDCSAVAKKFGGGGHPGAAGYMEALS